MNSYFQTNDKKECNGCGVCALKCPKKAIIMREDKEGFLYPVIEKKKCINCGLCRKICSNIPSNSSDFQETYIAINKNDEIKKNSSSGGIFYSIAEYVIEHNGVVFGVEYDKNLKVRHNYVHSKKDLKKFQGSKYVRSDINNAYVLVEKFLKKGQYVLFSGTPCQCYGLKKFLNKTYDKLITCEIICHANPSPKIFEYYKKNLELKYNKKIKNIYFRSKINGWSNQTTIIIFEDDTIIKDKSYFKAFVSEMINRPSCYNCKFCSEIRYSDFTIADFWGIEKIDPSIINDETGISLLNVNTDKAREIFPKISSNLFLKKVNTKQAFSYNRHCNVKVSKYRDRFFKGIADGKINENNIIKYMNFYTNVPLYKKVINKIKRIIGKLIRIKKCNNN